MDVGFIGLGNMGLPIARNLLKAGHTLIVYNRTRAKANGIESEGAQVADHVRGLAGCQIVLSMLADDTAVADTILKHGGLSTYLERGAIHVSLSTISVELSRRLAGVHERAGQRYVGGAVFGRPDAAARAALFVVAAGDPAAIDPCRPLFDALGQRTFVVGAKPEDANLVKVSGNFLIASVIESLAEAMTLVHKGGVERAQFLEVLTSTLFGAPVYQTYGNFIANESYEPAGFAAHLGLKDVTLALEAARAANVPLPIASLVRDQLISALARGYQDQDWSVLGRVAMENAGVKAAPK